MSNYDNEIADHTNEGPAQAVAKPSILQKLQKVMQDDIERIRRAGARLERVPLNEWQERFPQGYWMTDFCLQPNFVLPLDFALLGPIREFIKELNHKTEVERQLMHESSIHPTVVHYFRISTPEGEWYDVNLRSEKEGSTCEIRQIGLKEVPLLEVVCKDAVDVPLPTDQES
jgi:hypothetical protein